MAIEFRCTTCDQLLRTPDGSGGRQAQCPQCGELMPIPVDSPFTPPPRDPRFAETLPAGSAFAAAPTAQHAAYREPASPYQSPVSDSRLPEEVPPLVPSRVDLSQAVDDTWLLFKANWLLAVVGALVAHLCSQVATVLVVAILSAFGNSGSDVATVFSGVLIAPISFVISTFFMFGAARFFLRMARTGETDFADLFSASPILIPATMLMALWTLGWMLGLILLVVPGVIFVLTYALAPLMMLDRGTGVIDSFRLSATAMSGNKWTLLGLTAIFAFAGLAITLLTCLIGGLLVAPFGWLLYAVFYLAATGQKNAAGRSAAAPAFSVPGAQPPG